MSQLQHKTPFRASLLMPTISGNSSYEVVTVNCETNKRGQCNQCELKFYAESDGELRLKREEALKALNPVPQTEMDIDPKDFFSPELSFPHPPPRDVNMTPAQLDAQEHKYFKEYVVTLQKSKHWKDISYFEPNLQTWRQLWNVLEMCDILLLVVDVRYAGMMFPPSLYDYIRKVNKDMVLVLNKIDLVPPVVVASWHHYFTERYPGLEVVYFTSCQGYKLVEASTDKAGLQIRRRNGRQRMCIPGSTCVLEACKDLVKGQVDLSAWSKKILVESKLNYVVFKDEEKITEKPNTQYFSHNKYKNGVLTVGCLGAPNVGKSSLINSIMGEKVVSVSRSPGHTEHFQTIYLTDEVRLCDCPGLVFPSLVPRAVQVLMGSYPIAQLREPYTTIRYLGERLDLPSLLRIQHPDNGDSWSPRDICDGWAKKRGYPTSKEVKLDKYRAAKSLLRMALAGTLYLCMRPRLSSEEFEKIKTSEDFHFIEWCQGRSRSASVSETDPVSENSDDSGDKEKVEHIAIVNKLVALAYE